MTASALLAALVVGEAVGFVGCGFSGVDEAVTLGLTGSFKFLIAALIAFIAEFNSSAVASSVNAFADSIAFVSSAALSEEYGFVSIFSASAIKFSSSSL